MSFMLVTMAIAYMLGEDLWPLWLGVVLFVAALLLL